MQKLKTLIHNQDLMKKILITFGLLFLFRLGCALPVPFVQSDVLSALFGNGDLFSYMNMMGGGALEKSAVFALGVSPYINASIVIQLLCVAIPLLERLQKEDPKQIRKITQWLALVMGFVSAFGYYALMRNFGALQYTQGYSGVMSGIIIVLLFVAGSQLVMWIGWQIDDYGIGNGMSLLIFAGIISRWSEISYVFQAMQTLWAEKDWRIIVLGLLPIAAVLSIFFVVKVNDTEARISVTYSRAMPASSSRSTNSYIPVKLIMSGVMPIIFAGSVISLPATLGIFVDTEKHANLHAVLVGFNSTNWVYCVLYVALIFAFNYFYIGIQFDGVQMANNLRGNGGVIPGIRPGKPTSDYLTSTANKTAPIGAFILALIAAAPIVMGNLTGLSIQLGGTSLLIVCGVALEEVAALDSYLTLRHHTGILS